MYKYRIPATTANIGIGFDVLGMAINIYDYFQIEESNEFIFEGFMHLKLEDNLFYLSYQKTCKLHNDIIKPLKVFLKADIPISRGLGSSSAIIVGGILAYYLINNKPINKEEMLEIATEIEGHPDNVAPCIYGGLCIVANNILLKQRISNKWHFSILIPNYEVKTTEARKVIKHEIDLKDCVSNISSALIGIDALKTFNIKNISLLNNDKLHEPYRKLLIKDYEICKDIAYKNGAKAFLISGSGSTMLIISDIDMNLNLKEITFKKIKVDYKGALCLKNY